MLHFVAVGIALLVSACADQDDNPPSPPPPPDPECPPPPELKTEPLPLSPQKMMDFFSPLPAEICAGISDPTCLETNQRMHSAYQESIEFVLPQGSSLTDLENGLVPFSVYREKNRLELTTGESGFYYSEDSFAKLCPDYFLQPSNGRSLVGVWFLPDPEQPVAFIINGHPWNIDMLHSSAVRVYDPASISGIIEQGEFLDHHGLLYYLGANLHEGNLEDHHNRYFGLGLHQASLGSPQVYECSFRDICALGQGLEFFQNTSGEQTPILDAFETGVVYYYTP